MKYIRNIFKFLGAGLLIEFCTMLCGYIAMIMIIALVGYITAKTAIIMCFIVVVIALLLYFAVRKEYGFSRAASWICIGLSPLFYHTLLLYLLYIDMTRIEDAAEESINVFSFYLNEAHMGLVLFSAIPLLIFAALIGLYELLNALIKDRNPKKEENQNDNS